MMLINQFDILSLNHLLFIYNQLNIINMQNTHKIKEQPSKQSSTPSASFIPYNHLNLDHNQYFIDLNIFKQYHLQKFSIFKQLLKKIQIYNSSANLNKKYSLPNNQQQYKLHEALSKKLEIILKNNQQQGHQEDQEKLMTQLEQLRVWYNRNKQIMFKSRIKKFNQNLNVQSIIKAANRTGQKVFQRKKSIMNLQKFENSNNEKIINIQENDSSTQSMSTIAKILPKYIDNKQQQLPEITKNLKFSDRPKEKQKKLQSLGVKLEQKYENQHFQNTITVNAKLVIEKLNKKIHEEFKDLKYFGDQITQQNSQEKKNLNSLNILKLKIVDGQVIKKTIENQYKSSRSLSLMNPTLTKFEKFKMNQYSAKKQVESARVIEQDSLKKQKQIICQQTNKKLDLKFIWNNISYKNVSQSKSNEGSSGNLNYLNVEKVNLMPLFRSNSDIIAKNYKSQDRSKKSLENDFKQSSFPFILQNNKKNNRHGNKVKNFLTNIKQFQEELVEKKFQFNSKFNKPQIKEEPIEKKPHKQDKSTINRQFLSTKYQQKQSKIQNIATFYPSSKMKMNETNRDCYKTITSLERINRNMKNRKEILS